MPVSEVADLSDAIFPQAFEAYNPVRSAASQAMARGGAAAMLDQIGLYSHLGAAISFAVFALWLIARRSDHWSGFWLAVAAIATVGWAAMTALAAGYEDTAQLWAPLGETVRNAAWLGFLAMLARTDRANQASRERRFAIIVIGGLLVAQALFDMALRPAMDAPLLDGAGFLSVVLRIATAIGLLLLIHNLYHEAVPSARWSVRLLCVGLGALIAYDLNLYTIAFLYRHLPVDLVNLRGFASMIVLPLIAVAARRNQQFRLQFSHAAAFQTFALLAIGTYLILMAIAVWGLRLIGGDWSRLFQILFLFATLVTAVVIAMSSRARAWARVKIAKHFLAYKYDYREEWLRFIRTVGVARAGYGELPERVIRAIAAIVGAPGGILFTLDEGEALNPAARWNWHDFEAQPIPVDSEMIRAMAKSGRIVNLDELRSGEVRFADAPQWLLDDRRAWLIVPFIHLERLAGALLLERPHVPADLNWEDFDLLRTVGKQAASYIAEAHSQVALLDAQKFDEFNRRFAFIMHDIKNLVSQLSLLARNAERHADNPEFRADMIATLQGSVGKMNDLLVRLSQHSSAKPDERRPVDLVPLVKEVAAAKAPSHPVELELQCDPVVMGDPHRIEQIIAHLVQNAIDASPEDRPVRIVVRQAEDAAEIDVVDEGTGMSPAFLRDRLFKPFSSTKAAGFGIGAYESREMTRSMGGTLTVWSREGEGSRFTVRLPVASVEESRENSKRMRSG